MTLDRLIPRLLSRAVRQSNGCLTVQCKSRYLDVVYDDRREHAHRAIWEYNHGPIPEGHEVCHNCPGGDNSRCIEIGHLLCATHAWNMADRDTKGRNGTLGEASPLHKLTSAEVLAIYDMMQRGLEVAGVATLFSISPATVKRISNRQTWRHILPLPHFNTQNEN